MVSVKATAFARVATTDEVPSSVMRKVTVDGVDVVLANVDGEYHAMSNLCTHHGGPLDEGTLRGFEVECSWHGSRFDLRTGAVTRGPAVTSVRGYEVKVDGNNILIRAK